MRLNLPRVNIRMYFMIGTNDQMREIQIQVPDNAASKVFQEVAASMVTQLKCVNRFGPRSSGRRAGRFALPECHAAHQNFC